MVSQKTVLITGCSEGGIGDALALEFHARGLRVIATARRIDSMSKLANSGITTLALDVTDIDSVTRVKQEVLKLTGGVLDILVNNAGQGYQTAAIDFNLDRAKALFDVNVYGPMKMVQTFVEFLIASKNGHIVQIGSTAALVPVLFSSVYSASKGALHSYSDTLRVELAPFKVKVTTVVAGGVDTNIGKPSGIPESSIYHPMEAIYQEKCVGITKGTMPPAQFAKKVVDEALSQNPSAWLWAGHMAWLIWILHTFFGKRIFDFMSSKRFGISDFNDMIKSGKVKVA